MMFKWRLTSFKSRCQIYVSWNYSSVEKTEHAIVDIIFSDRRWISKWIITEILGKDSLGEKYFVWSSCSNAELFKFNVADSSLTSAIFEKIGLRKHIFLSQNSMSTEIFRISSQIIEFLFIHENFDRFAQQSQLLRNCGFIYSKIRNLKNSK